MHDPEHPKLVQPTVRCACAAPSEWPNFDHVTALAPGMLDASPSPIRFVLRLRLHLIASRLPLKAPPVTPQMPHEPPALAGSATSVRCFGSRHSDVTHDMHDSLQVGFLFGTIPSPGTRLLCIEPFRTLLYVRLFPFYPKTLHHA